MDGFFNFLNRLIKITHMFISLWNTILSLCIFRINLQCSLCKFYTFIWTAEFQETSWNVCRKKWLALIDTFKFVHRQFCLYTLRDAYESLKWSWVQLFSIMEFTSLKKLLTQLSDLVIICKLLLKSTLIGYLAISYNLSHGEFDVNSVTHTSSDIVSTLFIVLFRQVLCQISTLVVSVTQFKPCHLTSSHLKYGLF